METSVLLLHKRVFPTGVGTLSDLLRQCKSRLFQETLGYISKVFLFFFCRVRNSKQGGPETRKREVNDVGSVLFSLSGGQDPMEQ